MKLYFVTGNKYKFEEAKHFLKNNIQLEQKQLDIVEIQGTEKEITKDKAKNVAEYLKAPVFVDDTSLRIKAWNDLPGPYVSHFMEAIGPEGLYKMLDKFEDKSAEVVCILGYCKPGTEPIIFKGVVPGKIAEPVEGRFDFDRIFIPEGHDKRYCEMSMEEKNKISHRAKALKKLNKYLHEGIK